MLRRATAAVVLSLVVGASAGCSSDGPTTGSAAGSSAGSADSASASPSAGTPAASPVTEATRVGSVVPEAPVSITLPDGTVVPVRSVSTTRNGILDVPEEIDEAGWWRGGSKIGDPFGSTLIAAHVDSRTQGLGPFADLLSVRPGQQVIVRTDGLEQAFAIRTLRLRPRHSISSDSWLHSARGERRLTLVTCASPFVPELGGYQNLAVIVAVPVREPVPRTAG